MEKLVVTAAVAAVRESQAEGALLSDEMLCGMTAELLERCGGKIFHLRSFYGYEGYASADSFVQKDDRSDTPKLIVTGSYVNVQREPSMRSETIFSLPRGSIVQAEGPSAGGWQRVHLAGGQQGFIQWVHLAEFPLSAGLPRDKLRLSLCRNALAYMGSCYRWGGKTPLGIDCSGLCSQVYLNHGISIYRDADIMEGFPVKKIAFSQLRPADLLYFREHMALWLGDGRYIHSSASSGGVTVNSIIKGEPDYRDDLSRSLLACGTVF